MFESFYNQFNNTKIQRNLSTIPVDKSELKMVQTSTSDDLYYLKEMYVMTHYVMQAFKLQNPSTVFHFLVNYPMFQVPHLKFQDVALNSSTYRFHDTKFFEPFRRGFTIQLASLIDMITQIERTPLSNTLNVTDLFI